MPELRIACMAIFFQRSPPQLHAALDNVASFQDHTLSPRPHAQVQSTARQQEESARLSEVINEADDAKIVAGLVRPTLASYSCTCLCVWVGAGGRWYHQ